MPKNTICLWFESDAESAAQFYAETFPDSEVTGVHRAPSDNPSVKAGEVLNLPLVMYNRDPETFEHAEKFIVDREVNNHIGFGAGPHRCLGSNLARLELRIALERWLARFPRFEPNGEPVWTIGVRGPATVPLRLLDGAAACE